MWRMENMTPSPTPGNNGQPAVLNLTGRGTITVRISEGTGTEITGKRIYGSCLPGMREFSVSVLHGANMCFRANVTLLYENLKKVSREQTSDQISFFGSVLRQIKSIFIFSFPLSNVDPFSE